MNIASRAFLAGPLIAIVLVVGTIALALLDPGYSQIRQTISEIGSFGSPLRVPFALLICIIGVLELVLAAAVRNTALRSHRSRATAYLIALSAVWSFGIAIFAEPHPLHGVFGYVGLGAMLSPIVFAVTWRGDPGAKTVVFMSWVLGLIVWSGIIGFAISVATARLGPIIGLVQRTFLYSWAVWCALIGIFLRRMNFQASVR